MKYEQLAKAFAEGRACHSGNARTDGQTYWLHGHPIATKTTEGIVFDWCGWHTQTTARHMNNLLHAVGSSLRVSAAAALKEGQTAFTVELCTA